MKAHASTSFPISYSMPYTTDSGPNGISSPISSKNDYDSSYFELPNSKNKHFLHGAKTNKIISMLTNIDETDPDKIFDGSLYVGFSGNDDLKSLIGKTILKGDLVIEGKYLTSLASLKDLKIITGSIKIKKAPHLTSFHGLEGLVAIGGEISVWQSGLTSLNALKSLRKAPSMKIEYCPDLTSLMKFPEGKPISHLILNNLPNLPDLQDLSHASSISELMICDCPLIKDLQGLQHLAFINGLYLTTLTDLTDISALSFMKTARVISIVDCKQLPHVHGLQNVTRCGWIQFNMLPLLQNIEGLSNVQQIETLSMQSCQQLKSYAPLQNAHVEKDIRLIHNGTLPDVIRVEDLQAMVKND